MFKTEPDVYGIDDLARDRRTGWDGVRNYQARNLLRDELAAGDGALIYHSNADPLAVVGVARIATGGYPDDTAWDPRSEYHDPNCDPEEPTWFRVDLEFEGKFVAPVTRDQLKAVPALYKMVLLQRGSRLSIQPVTAIEWRTVLRLAGHAEAAEAGDAAE